MISPSQRLFYVDPLTSHARRKGVTEVLVTRVWNGRTYNSPLGKVNTFEEFSLRHDTMGFLVDGLWVDGQVVSASDALPGTDRVLLFGDEARFGIGTLNSSGRFDEVVFSDGTALPAGVTLNVTRHVAAAPWAREFMPLPGEPSHVVRSKVDAAEALFRLRQAEAVIWAEAAGRDSDYTEDLVNHSINGVISKAGWMQYVSATVMLPGSTEAKVEDTSLQSFLASFKETSISGVSTPIARPVVDVSFFLNTEPEGEEVDDGPSREKVEYNLRHQFGYYADLLTYSHVNILNTLTPAA